MSDWKRGDVVELKSGGPKMTVTMVDDDREKRDALIRCSWFLEGVLQYASFHPDTVKSVEEK